MGVACGKSSFCSIPDETLQELAESPVAIAAQSGAICASHQPTPSTSSASKSATSLHAAARSAARSAISSIILRFSRNFGSFSATSKACLTPRTSRRARARARQRQDRASRQDRRPESARLRARPYRIARRKHGSVRGHGGDRGRRPARPAIEDAIEAIEFGCALPPSARPAASRR